MQADILDGRSRAAAFGWMHGILSLSHVLGNFLARLLPGTYIFEACVFDFTFFCSCFNFSILKCHISGFGGTFDHCSNVHANLSYRDS